MNRIEFTKNLCNLILQMNEAGETVILDYVKRSATEQNHLYAQGKSKCDGFTVISQHQLGRAADIYFLNMDATKGKIGLCDPLKGYEHWHKVWSDMGGDDMIEWDKGHFSG